MACDKAIVTMRHAVSDANCCASRRARDIDPSLASCLVVPPRASHIQKASSVAHGQQQRLTDACVLRVSFYLAKTPFSIPASSGSLSAYSSGVGMSFLFLRSAS